MQQTRFINIIKYGVTEQIELITYLLTDFWANCACLSSVLSPANSLEHWTIETFEVGTFSDDKYELKVASELETTVLTTVSFDFQTSLDVDFISRSLRTTEANTNVSITSQMNSNRFWRHRRRVPALNMLLNRFHPITVYQKIYVVWRRHCGYDTTSDSCLMTIEWRAHILVKIVRDVCNNIVSLRVQSELRKYYPHQTTRSWSITKILFPLICTPKNDKCGVSLFYNYWYFLSCINYFHVDAVNSSASASAANTRTSTWKWSSAGQWRPPDQQYFEGHRTPNFQISLFWCWKVGAIFWYNARTLRQSATIRNKFDKPKAILKSYQSIGRKRLHRFFFLKF